MFIVKERGSEKARFAGMNPPWRLGVAVKRVSGEKDGAGGSICSFWKYL